MAQHVISSDSGRVPGTKHQVWMRWLTASGSSRSHKVFQTDDMDHAARVAAVLNEPSPTVNHEAVHAAMHARGPRCDRCTGWTFRPEYLPMPEYIARLCPDCLPLKPEHMEIKTIALSQIFKRDLPRYADRDVISL